jgi:hypothetical protein
MSELWIHCEGSGTPVLHHLCTMCGELLPIGCRTIPEHERRDVLGMLDRGDFDE